MVTATAWGEGPREDGKKYWYQGTITRPGTIDNPHPDIDWYIVDWSTMPPKNLWKCFYDEYCQDLAAALNDAHEERTRGTFMDIDCGNRVIAGYHLTKKDCEDSK